MTALKNIFAFLFLLLLGCTTTLPSQSTEFACPDCNVILISIDTLRADHVGVYGYDKDTTPNIDRLAEESFVFVNARSESSWTAPAHASLLFSKYPHELNFYRYAWPASPGKISNSEVSLAEELKQHNYLTQASHQKLENSN